VKADAEDNSHRRQRGQIVTRFGRVAYVTFDELRVELMYRLDAERFFRAPTPPAAQLTPPAARAAAGPPRRPPGVLRVQ